MNCEACGHENLAAAHFCAKCGVQMASEGSKEGDWIGRLIGGRFRINKVLGEGGMGIVYEGEQQMGSTTRLVAIKTLHAHLSNDPSVLARFHRECGTVAELEHPNTIKFYDFGKEADGTLYIAMEYLDGRSLDQVIEEEGALAPTRAVKILKQICGALDEAHDKGVVHRDLKPENVVLFERLGDKDFVKVLDFGIAARSESADSEKEAKLTQQGMVLGTPPYMSPEQFTGAELDRRSDVYSLGVMAYEMLTAQLPFHANTPWQWATEHMTAQPFPIDQVPSGGAVPRPMRDAVMRALEKDPDARPATAGEFLSELEAGLAGSLGPGVSAPTEQMQAVPAFTGPASSQPASFPGGPQSTSTQSEMSATQPIQIPTKKGKGGLIAGALIGVAVLGGAAFLFTGKSKPEPVEDPNAAASGETAPEDPPADPEDPKPEDTDPVADGDGDDAKDPASPSPAPSPSPSTSPSPSPGPSPSPSPSPDPTPDTSEADACEKCISAARNGNWNAATNAFGTCSATGQAKCTDVARKAATAQVADAVKKSQCKKAKSIVSGAAGVKASNSLLAVAAKRCK